MDNWILFYDFGVLRLLNDILCIRELRHLNGYFHDYINCLNDWKMLISYKKIEKNAFNFFKFYYFGFFLLYKIWWVNPPTHGGSGQVDIFVACLRVSRADSAHLIPNSCGLDRFVLISLILISMSSQFNHRIFQTFVNK